MKRNIFKFILIILPAMVLVLIPLVFAIFLTGSSNRINIPKPKIMIDVYTLQDDKVYVTNVVDLKERATYLDDSPSRYITLYFPLPFKSTPNSIRNVIDENVVTESPYNFEKSGNSVKLTIYARNYDTFINGLKEKDYKLEFSYYLRLKDFIGYLDEEKTQFGFFLSTSGNISELNIHIGDNQLVIPNHQRNITKVNDGLYKRWKRIDDSETRVKIDKNKTSSNFGEWDEEIQAYIKNKKIIIPVVYMCLGIEIGLILFLIISRIKNKVSISKGKYIKDPDGLLNPILIESLIDRKVNPNNIITTCIINMIKKGIIKNIDNDTIQLVNISDINKIEKIILDILFLNKDGNKEVLEKYVGKTISISELNKKIKNDNNFSVFFHRKYEELKLNVKNQLIREKCISAKWDRMMKFIRSISNILIVCTLWGFSILTIRYSRNNVPYYFIMPLCLMGVYGASQTKDYPFILTLCLIFIVLSLISILAYTFIILDYTVLLFIVTEIVFVIIGKCTNTYVYTSKGKEECKKARMFKNYLIDYSLISNRDMDGLIIYDDYLVYATAFGITSIITKRINSNLVDLNSKVQKLIT